MILVIKILEAFRPSSPRLAFSPQRCRWERLSVSHPETDLGPGDLGNVYKLTPKMEASQEPSVQ